MTTQNRSQDVKTEGSVMTAKTMVCCRRCKKVVTNKIISQEQTSKLLRRRYTSQFAHALFFWHTTKFDFSDHTLQCGFIKCYFSVHTPTGRGYTHLPGKLLICRDYFIYFFFSFDNGLLLLPKGESICPVHINMHNKALINT